MKSAPILHLTRQDGLNLRIPDRLREKAWLLYFMRTSSCPPCMAHVQRIDREADVLRGLGVEPLIVVPEGPQAAAALHQRLRLRVGVASSPHDDVHAMMGLQKKIFGIAQQSGTVLIGRDGNVHLERVATIPLNSYKHDEVLETARAIALGRDLAAAFG